MTGKFITFEGNECCGKSTQINLLADRLTKEGYNVRKLREPGGTELGEVLRPIIKRKDWKTKVYPETHLCMFQAARAQLVREVIKPALANGEIVLCDRFYDSTWVYQGWVEGINNVMVEFSNKLAVGALNIDKTFLFEVPTDVILARLEKRGKGSEDYFDSKGPEYFKKVSEGYEELYRYHKNRIEKINGNRFVEEVHEELVAKAIKVIEQ